MFASKIAVVITLVVVGLMGGTPSQALQPDREPLDGAELYRRHCADCHRPLAKTTKPDRSASRIRSSIRHFHTMRHLESLSMKELRAIADALAIEP